VGLLRHISKVVNFKAVINSHTLAIPPMLMSLIISDITLKFMKDLTKNIDFLFNFSYGKISTILISLSVLFLFYRILRFEHVSNHWKDMEKLRYLINTPPPI